MRTHITSLFWKVEKPATPLIKLEQGKKVKYKPITRNTHIQVKKDYGKKCTGYYKNGKFHKCPNNNKIKYGYQCSECREKNNFLTCAKCTGEKCNASKERRKKCKQTHFLYLTIIGKKIKIGVTRANRYLNRWIEQGSDYSTIIKSGHGMSMRKEENRISKELPDMIRTKYKIKNYLKHDKKILQKYLQEKEYNTPIINIRQYYPGINSIPTQPLQYKGLLNGRIVSAKGRVIVFEKDNLYYYYNLNDLIGHEVDIKIERRKTY